MHNRRNETTIKGINIMSIIEQIIFDLYIENYGYEHVVKHYQYFSKCVDETYSFICSEFRDYRKAIE